MMLRIFRNHFSSSMPSSACSLLLKSGVSKSPFRCPILPKKLNIAMCSSICNQETFRHHQHDQSPCSPSHCRTMLPASSAAASRRWSLSLLSVVPKPLGIHCLRDIHTLSMLQKNLGTHEENQPNTPAGDLEMPVVAETEFDESQYDQMMEEYNLLPDKGHNILIIQPDIKWGPKKINDFKPELLLREGRALIGTLPGWKVVEAALISVKHPEKRYIFGKGNFAELTKKIKSKQSQRKISAVFMNVEMLSGLQAKTLEQEWNIPVFDRYTIVLQIFKIHAKSKETKLQVSLAEIPYFKSRLRGIEPGSLDRHRGGLGHIGGSGETLLQTRVRLLQYLENKLSRDLLKIRKQRNLLREARLKKGIPTVAVVGYTNAGKTSLIKVLTGEADLQPRNQLFATLDITAHAGTLNNHMTVIYLDTVGFMSYIPTGLIEAFNSTLEEVLSADVVIHVCDISHPNCEAQKAHVEKTLKDINLPDNLLENIIVVYNKCDLVKNANFDKSVLCVSTAQGTGLDELRETVEACVVKEQGLKQMTFVVPASGQHLAWLYKESTVENVDSDDTGYKMVVDVLISDAACGKFLSYFKDVECLE